MLRIVILSVSLFIIFVQTVNAQTILFSEDFENGNTSFDINTLSMSSTTDGFNSWIINNEYAGGSGTSSCFGLSFTVESSPPQPIEIGNSPNSNYMHIVNEDAMASGILNANYVPSDGGLLCFTDETYFTEMSDDISTLGYDSIDISFWWMCGGSDAAFGELMYSTDEGNNWAQASEPLNFTNSWTESQYTNENFSNQETIRFGFRYSNLTDFSGLATDPSLSIDEINITGFSLCLPTTSVDERTECDSFTWIDGNTYTSNNQDAVVTLIDSQGCDSLIVLDLTINNSSFSTDVQNACDNFTWLDGTTYTENNTEAVYLLTNSFGCDSLITLDLIINNSDSTVDIQNSCDSIIWIDGNTYFSDNSSATHLLNNMNGCDSVVTLNLTVNNLDTSVLQSGSTLTANEENGTYQWIDCETLLAIDEAIEQTFLTLENGDYAVLITNEFCSDTSACYTIMIDNIEENFNKNEFLVYPNPNQGSFFIDLGKNHASAVFTLSEINGREIHSANFSGQVIEYSIKESAGIYFLTIQTEDYTKTIKLIFQ